MSLNIDGSDDPFYRYKMPAVRVTTVSKNGGQTSFNINDIAKSLARSESHIIRFLAMELNTQANPKTYIIRGNHSTGTIQAAIYKFTKYVICPTCGTPETGLLSPDRAHVIIDCIACGRRQPLTDDKFLSAIMKTLPSE